MIVNELKTNVIRYNDGAIHVEGHCPHCGKILYVTSAVEEDLDAALDKVKNQALYNYCDRCGLELRSTLIRLPHRLSTPEKLGELINQVRYGLCPESCDDCKYNGYCSCDSFLLAERIIKALKEANDE